MISDCINMPLLSRSSLKKVNLRHYLGSLTWKSCFLVDSLDRSMVDLGAAMTLKINPC